MLQIQFAWVSSIFFGSGNAIASFSDKLSGVEFLVFLRAMCRKAFIGIDLC